MNHNEPASLLEQNTEEQDSNAQQIEGLAARDAAYEILQDVLERKQSLDISLEQNSKLSDLDAQDRGFVRMLTATTIRRLGQIDDLISKASEREGADISPPSVRTLLRMGTAQLCFMAAANYAAVDTAVELAEQKGLSRQKGFVNAVLREITRHYQMWLPKQDEVRLNTPDWLMKLWIEDYGLRTAAEIAQANLSEAAIDITVKDPSNLDLWAEKLDCSILPTGSLRRRESGNVTSFEGFDDGLWWVQDVSAALPAKLMGDFSGQQIIDMCAAPGGKTAQMAAMGANVKAIDRSTARLKRLDFNIQRLGLTDYVEIEVSDSAAWQAKEAVPYILLDAPCSATGTIRRHPDVPYLKSEDDVTRLCDIQRRILLNACNQLMVGGVLIYCTCSLQKIEGEQQIQWVLSENPSMRRIAIQSEEVDGLDEILTEQGDVRILPFHLATHGGMDGFYIARLTKVE